MDKNNLLNKDELFNDIYDKLVVYHSLNDVYIIDKKIIKSKNLKRLLELLKSEGIDFEITENQVICSLSEEKKAIARKVYTPEAIKHLEKEQRLLDFKFWNHDIY